MAELVLRDKETTPTNEILKEVLQDRFSAFEKLEKSLSKLEIILEWNYYNDGKAWMCKLLSKKKNLGWLNIYDTYFRVTCYFTEKHLTQIEESKISKKTKEEFYTAKPSGKLILMTIEVPTIDLPEDILTMILFKKSLK